jgi:hypothetical protein
VTSHLNPPVIAGGFYVPDIHALDRTSGEYGATDQTEESIPHYSCYQQIRNTSASNTIQGVFSPPHYLAQTAPPLVRNHGSAKGASSSCSQKLNVKSLESTEAIFRGISRTVSSWE